MGRKTRRNISIDKELDEWLENVHNASGLICDLLMAYKAYGGNEMETVQYVLRKRVNDTAEEL